MVISLPTISIPHPGRLDKNCGHHNRKTGEYHYHYERCREKPTTQKKGKITGKVVKVRDGDTIVVSPIERGKFFVCRLHGIDTPETPKYTRKGKLSKSGQPFGREATNELKKLILGQKVEVTLTGAKTYNREVCLIQKNGKDINLEMLKRGYA